MLDNRKGFTLMELIVTVLIIGVLTSFAVPQYLKTVESGKADDAVSLVNMIGTTNKMFALDHGGYYVYGPFTASCTGGGVTCPTSVSGAQSGACILVACKYLADQDWGNKPYSFNACDATGGSGGGACAAGLVAAAARNGGYSPYSGWGYTMNTAGVISASGSAPTPTY